MAKPPFPWIGGKEKIAPYILQLFPPIGAPRWAKPLCGCCIT